MDRKGLLVPIALGLVPAIVFLVYAERGVTTEQGVSNAASPVALFTTVVRSPQNTAAAVATLAATSTSRPPYVPAPTMMLNSTAPTVRPTVRLADTPMPSLSATGVPTATVTATPTMAATATVASPTSTATATATRTATSIPTPTPIPRDFIVLSRDEQCDSTSPANYSGNLVGGRVLDVNGGPLQGIRVKIASIRTSSPWSAETTSDNGGTFTFYLTKGNFEVQILSGSSEVASELWTRSTAEVGVCRWLVTFKKTRS